AVTVTNHGFQKSLNIFVDMELVEQESIHIGITRGIVPFEIDESGFQVKWVQNGLAGGIKSIVLACGTTVLILYGDDSAGKLPADYSLPVWGIPFVIFCLAIAPVGYLFMGLALWFSLVWGALCTLGVVGVLLDPYPSHELKLKLLHLLAITLMAQGGLVAFSTMSF
ncbi:MAG: hypothetical protein AAFV33_06645, partial [Chloroflexota bacterium]